MEAGSSCHSQRLLFEKQWGHQVTETLTGSHWKSYENRLKEVRPQPGDLLRDLGELPVIEAATVAVVCETGDTAGKDFPRGGRCLPFCSPGSRRERMRWKLRR